ncbi:hypothetical protein PHLCEN_2v4245 [Hermanssonia centrifuga]|uniref:Uncharacterized protein n=1 Tax=Hermanssonia centrifuga TaxID=98765 RepID=A0A2R6PYX1_9APHY|nr:hypothetical protein PHLCEN_2v4245 [Hermanssonia centrifuga]
MSDNDVQDIRDIIMELRYRKEDELVKRDPVPGYAAQEETRKKREAMSKNDRMGVARAD